MDTITALGLVVGYGAFLIMLIRLTNKLSDHYRAKREQKSSNRYISDLTLQTQIDDLTLQVRAQKETISWITEVLSTHERILSDNSHTRDASPSDSSRCSNCGGRYQSAPIEDAAPGTGYGYYEGGDSSSKARRAKQRVLDIIKENWRD